MIKVIYRMWRKLVTKSVPVTDLMGFSSSTTVRTTRVDAESVSIPFFAVVEELKQ